MELVPPKPASPPGTALSLCELPALADSAAPFAGCGQTTQLPVLLHGVAQPVNLRVSGHGLVVRVNHDDLEVLVSGVLTHPVRVEDSESFQPSADAFLGDGLQVPLGLLLFHSAGALGFAIRAPLGHRAFAATATHGDAVNDIA